MCPATGGRFRTSGGPDIGTFPDLLTLFFDGFCLEHVHILHFSEDFWYATNSESSCLSCTSHTDLALV